MILDRPLRAEIAREMTEALRGARVRRVHQPLPDCLVLSLRGSGGERRVLLSADPRGARVHLTSRKLENPPAAPAFCMLARKHLEGRPFLDASADPAAPAIHLRFGPRRADEEGRIVLTLEMAGHASTVALCAERDGARSILGLLRPLPAARRELSPGAPYRPPRLPGRLDPGRCSAAEIQEGLRRLRAQDKRPGKRGAAKDPARLLSRLFDGVGRHLAAEALAETNLAGGALPDPLSDAQAEALRASLGRLLSEPCAPRLVAGGDGGPELLLPFPLPATGLDGAPVESLSKALDDLCGAEGAGRALESHRARTLRALTRLVEHRERKLERQREDLAGSRLGDRWRKRADLLLAQPSPGRRGLAEIEVTDVFDPACPTLLIALDPARSLAENAERHYGRARKAKRAVSILERLIAQGEAEVRYFREQAVLAAQAGDTETLEAIDEALSERAQDRRGPAARAKRPEERARARETRGAASGPRRYLIAGWEVLVGRHGRDNDRLVTRTGRPADFWLHARDVPGAHVLVRCPASRPPTEAVLEGAARLAAYFSGARGERHAEVIVARLDQVRKPRGAPPGQVVVRRSRTLRVPATLPDAITRPPGDPPAPAG